MKQTFKAFPLGSVRLLPGVFQRRFELNRKYVVSLHNENLLQNFYQEAGLWSVSAQPEDCHWGLESPTCQLRGHFLGHWLSAGAHIYAATGDTEIKGKADRVVSELARCQRENGGEWAGSIPEKYLHWIAGGKSVWAPHYTIHKTLMGLYDMAALAGNEQALDIVVNWAKWFHRWTGRFSREQMDDILDFETGGMLEAWANLYGITGRQEHLDLVNRYDRPRLFQPLLDGKDVLTNLHANTTIPEAQGAARAYEVTGDDRWRKIVEAYWRCAVTDRGYFCTGGQTCGEIWTPPFEFAARLGDKNQEHCTVYNMIRLAEYLLRWTGDVCYADYIERNLYNGILAQQHPHTGMLSYFLPLEAGARKRWGSETNDFSCCYGTLVQAHTRHNACVYYEDDEGLVVTQYIPTELTWDRSGRPVTVRQTFDRQTGGSTKEAGQAGAAHRPRHWLVDLSVKSEEAAEFTLKLRLPWWLTGKAKVWVNGREEKPAAKAPSFHAIRRAWKDDKVRLELPKELWACPLPDESDTVGFMDGPVVLAGLCEQQRTLYGEKDDLDSILAADNEREWGSWLNSYRTRNQDRNFRLLPLYEVTDQRYTVYFPVRAPR